MWYFEYPHLDFDVQNIFYEILTNCSAQISPQIKSGQNLLKFISYYKYVNLNFDVKSYFIKYLPPARPKLVPKLKMLRIYWNLVHLIFRIPRSRFWCQKIIFIKYFPFAQNLFKFDKNWNLTKIFDKNYFWH